MIAAFKVIITSNPISVKEDCRIFDNHLFEKRGRGRVKNHIKSHSIVWSPPPRPEALIGEVLIGVKKGAEVEGNNHIKSHSIICLIRGRGRVTLT